jgi:putative ABC transport system permease protein
VGGVAGVLVAMWGVRLTVSALPPELIKFNPGWTRIAINRSALAYTMLVTLGTGVLFGLVPALGASRANLQLSLREGGRGSTAGGSRQRLRSALVVAEMALAVMLLVGTGLMVRTFIHLVTADPGYSREPAIAMSITLPGDRYDSDEKRVRFYRTLVDRARELPGVRSAAVVSELPMTWDNTERDIRPEGWPAPAPGEQPPRVRYRVASPEYFETLGIGLVRGRGFTTHDDSLSPPVAVVSERAARQFWPGADAIGQRIRLGNDSIARAIVGVVKDVRHNPNTGTDQLSATIYGPHAQQAWSDLVVVARTTGDAASLAPAIAREISALDPGLAAGNVQTVDRLMYTGISPQRITAGMLAVFAAVAVLLAVVGIYGVMSYTVAQRRHEIGVRLALGAMPGDVVGDLMRSAVKMAMSGVAIGLVGAFGLARGVSALLSGVSPTDPATFLGVVVVLILAAVAGALIPARRAARVDPAVALRAE